MFYKGKHFKPNPKIERIKNIPRWIWGEITFYLNWYKKQIIRFHNLLIKFGEKIITIGIITINKWDNFLETNFSKLFENSKKICYNYYRKLKKK